MSPPSKDDEEVAGVIAWLLVGASVATTAWCMSAVHRSLTGRNLW